MRDGQALAKAQADATAAGQARGADQDVATSRAGGHRLVQIDGSAVKGHRTGNADSRADGQRLVARAVGTGRLANGQAAQGGWEGPGSGVECAREVGRCRFNAQRARADESTGQWAGSVIAQHQGAARDGRVAAVGERAGQRERVAAALDQRARAADRIGQRQVVRSVDLQCAAVAHRAGAQTAGGPAAAHFQGARSNGGRAAVGVATGQREGARAQLGQGARAADGLRQAERIGAIDLQRAAVAHRTRAQSAGRATTADFQRAGRNRGGACVGVVAGERGGTA